jgi:hypothetical protein
VPVHRTLRRLYVHYTTICIQHMNHTPLPRVVRKSLSTSSFPLIIALTKNLRSCLCDITEKNLFSGERNFLCWSPQQFSSIHQNLVFWLDHSYSMKRLVVVGDSDIAYWPKELLPSAPSSDDAGKCGIGAETEWGQPLVSGHSGAALAGVLPHLRRVLTTESWCDGTGARTSRTSPSDNDTLIVVACAGENDIGDGLSLGKSVEALREFADAIFLETKHHCGDNDNVFLIFLGPKFEPWLEDDPSYKKKYTAMARAFRRCLEEYDDSTNTIKGHSTTASNNGDKNNENENDGQIHFIDCLTMFCGETANVPGARLGGRAKADPRFFASDQLHLSKEGYAIWKEVVETRIRRCLASSK